MDISHPGRDCKNKLLKSIYPSQHQQQKGHLNQQRQNARTTKVKDPRMIITEPDLDQGIKTQFLYAATIDAGQI
jgi:hypothetical protein